MGFEIAEQLGWRLPRHTVGADGQRLAPHQDRQGVPGGDQGRPHRRSSPSPIHGAQAAGCNPITAAFKAGDRSHQAGAEAEDHRQVARHRHARRRLLCGARDRAIGGSCEDATDEEIIEGIRLLAETEGIFAETAGGVTVACAKKLIESGKIPAQRIGRALHHRPRAQDGRSRRAASAAAPPHQPEPARIRRADRQ